MPTCLAARWLPKPRLSLTGLGEIGAYGVKASLNDVLDYVRSQIPNFLVSVVQGPARVGLFNKADSLSALPVRLISGSMYAPVFRALAQLQDNREKSKALCLRSLTLALAYCLPVYVLLWWLAEPFVRVVYGGQWIPAAEPLRILALSGLFWIITNQSGALIAAQNRLGRELLINAEGILLLFAAVAWGLPYGLAGVAYGILGVRIVYSLRMAHLANTLVGSRWRDIVKALGPPLLLNGILFGMLQLADWAWRRAGYADPWSYLATLAGIGGTVYLVSFMSMPVFRDEVAHWKRALRLSRLPGNPARTGV